MKSVKLEVERIFLSIDVAVPCGLILNELISNSLKHAFPAGAEGEITITVRTAGNGVIELRYRDNGVGLPANFDQACGRTLGLKLVTSLSKQLNGSMEIRSEGGALFILRFPNRANSSEDESGRDGSAP